MNDYMKKMNEARKAGKKSFEHNGSTYVMHKLKTGLITYKKK